MRPFPLTLSLCLLGCAGGAETAPGAESPATADAELIPNAAEALPGVTTGGQPSPAQLERAAAEGYATVISLRAEGERGAEGEAAQVEALGMRFVSIPVTGAADLTVDNARKLSDALSAEGALPAIVHCGSGNRVGALLAIKAFHVDGQDAEAAVELGKRAGLTRLEGAVRERLVRE